MSAPTSSFQFTVAFCRGEPVCSPAFASRRVRFSVRHSGACRNQGGRDIHWFWSTLRLPPASAGMTAMWPIAHNARGSTLPSPDSIRKTGRTRRSAPTGMRRTREQDCLNSMRRALTAHRPTGAPSRPASGRGSRPGPRIREPALSSPLPAPAPARTRRAFRALNPRLPNG